MRTAFVDALIAAASQDERVCLLTGDLGYTTLEPFQAKFPERFLNLGVAEQNLVGFAAGLALAGRVPIVYSIATFLTLKPLEQIRNDVCYQKLNLKLVGVGAGLTYSQYGATHQALEDLALMRVLPHMTVVCPGDPVEVEKAVAAILANDGPCYLRIGAKGEPRIHADGVEFRLGKGIVVSEGTELALFATGNMLANTVAAARLLEARGLKPRVVSMHTIKPLDDELLEDTFLRFRYVLCVEEHSLIGGLGSALSERIAERVERPFQFRRIAVADGFQETGGWLDFIRDKNGLSPEAIARTAWAHCRQVP